MLIVYLTCSACSSLLNDRCRYSVNVLWKFDLTNRYLSSHDASVVEIACIQETRKETCLKDWSWIETVNGRL